MSGLHVYNFQNFASRERQLQKMAKIRFINKDFLSNE